MDDINNVPPVSIDQIQSTIKPITSIDQINKIIKRKEIAYASHFMIPSLKKEVPFNEINTSQQKRLIKSVIDSPVYNTEFIFTFREILKENCQDPLVDIDNLTIIDKLILALGLRMKSVGDKIDVEVTTKDGSKVNVGLEASKILNMALNVLIDIGPQTLEDPYFKLVCSIPTIGSEYKVEKDLRSNTTNIEIENVEEIRQTIGDAFVSEIVKYISKVFIKDQDEKLIPIDWAQLKTSDRIKVVETFKTTLLKEIINYINNVRKEIDKIELINFEFKGEKYERRLTIDGNFFTIS
ncbi:MAG: hypothetical protein PHS54_00565 [Clostridia bacterium]|nr:hypothetical protein [Clostridia bacterium]